MFAALAYVLTSRAAGPVASVVAVILAIALAVTWTEGSRREAELKSEVAALVTRNQQAGAYWRTQLAACHAQAAAAFEGAERVTHSQDGRAAAAQLATQAPAGFDVCARMESADAAVLASLHKK